MSVAVEEARARVTKYLDAFSNLSEKGNHIHGICDKDETHDLLASDLELLLAGSASAIDELGMIDRFSLQVKRWESANMRQKRSIESLLDERARLSRQIKEMETNG